MSKIKRSFMQEEYATLDGLNRQALEEEAKKACCACWYYDIANEAEYMGIEDLKAIIADPYHAHRVQEDGEDWQEDCPQYQAEQAETIRDARREDGEL